MSQAHTRLRLTKLPVAVFLVLLSLSAWASKFNWAWVPLKTTQGCGWYTAVLNGQEADTRRKVKSASWDGLCDKGKISGPGTLRVEMLESGQSWSYWQEGTYVGGYEDGPFRLGNSFGPKVTAVSFVMGCNSTRMSEESHVRACVPRVVAHASPSSSPGQGIGATQVVQVKSFGNGCGAVETLSSDERSGRVFTRFRFRNTCKTAQLMEIVMGPNETPVSRPIGSYTNSLVRPVWPEATIARPQLPFVPVGQTGAAMLLGPEGTYEFELFQILPAKPYGYKVASCDYSVGNGVRAVFRDAPMDIDFICTVIPTR